MKKAFVGILPLILSAAFFAADVFAQGARVQIEQKREAEGVSMWWFVMIGFMLVVLAAVAYEIFRRRKDEAEAERQAVRKRLYAVSQENTINADLELARAKNKSKKHSKNTRKRAVQTAEKLSDDDVKTKLREISLKKKDEELPPVFALAAIETADAYEPLPVSTDEFLLDAIEQIHEEFEEDLEAREIALRILAAHRVQNAVEAVSQIALYELSSALRARAVLILADFDHESVFETVLLACADPTREVRAAAARALFRLSFERKQAWLRISEFTDAGRRRQCARALIAGDLVERSLERLTHRDSNYAAEAFAVAVLLVKSGETDEIFRLFVNHSDALLQKAILHVIKIAAEPESLEKLAEMRDLFEMPEEILAEIDAILENAAVLRENE